MRFWACFLCSLCLYFGCLSQNLEKEKKPKWSIYLETGITPIFSQNSKTIFCYQGQLELEYNLFSKFQMGLFGQTLLYHQNTDIANIENKVIELSSIEYNTLGFSTGYKTQINKFIVYPKLDFGYNFFIAKSIDFPTDKTNFIDYRYFSIRPKVNLGYQFTEGFNLGLNISYNQQIIALKGNKLIEFDPSSYAVGFYVQIPIK